MHKHSKPTLTTATRSGFAVIVTPGGHFAARHPAGGPAVYYSSSPSCSRAHKNALSMLKRVLRKLHQGRAA